MTTLLDLVNETHLMLSGYTQRQDQATSLVNAIGATDYSLVVQNGTVLSRGLIEIDDEAEY